MANTITTNPTLMQLNSLSQLHIVRQLGFMLLLAASIALGIAIVLWSAGSDYTALYIDMSTNDSAEVIAALEQNGTEYKIDNNNGIVSVPSDQVQRIRLQLASSGLPRSSNKGYAILEEEQSLGTSNFMEQARYNRALEQELVQTIKRIDGVRDARVHLSIPKQSSFIRSSSSASASVMIDLFRVQSLNDTQLTGILHLVASSVAGLQTEDVSIVDQRGNLLSRDSNSEFGNSNENIRFARKIEEDYNNRIIDILTPIVGAGNVKAQVSADLDFTFIETTEETFDPSTSVIRSEQRQEENSGLANSGLPSSEPVSLSNNPPTDASDQASAVGNGQSRINSTRNYEIDRSVSLIRTVPGTINQISVAVLVDLHAGDLPTEVDAPQQSENLDQEKIDRLTQLVKDTIGFNEVRGDSVSVINEQFIAAAEFTPAEATPIWLQSWVYSAARLLAAAAVVMFLIFGVLRPAMKSVVSQQNSLPNRGVALSTRTETMQIDDDQVSLSGDASGGSLAAPAPGKSIYDENLTLAQTLVQNEPARAARMIQNWLTNE